MAVKSLEPDVFNSECPARKALDLVADKWSLLVLLALLGGTKRHSTLQRKIKGVTQKMLTQTLRRLERDGLVERTVYATVPPKVEYALTSLGETLSEPIRALSAWAETHSLELEAARLRQPAADSA